MPVRRRVSAIREQAVDPVSAFEWSMGDGLEHFLGLPHYQTRTEAERAWRQVRREIWATAYRFRVPATATVFDAITDNARDQVLDSWNHVTFGLEPALAAIAEDRTSLEAFERREPRAAKQIADFLGMRRADLAVMEQTARDLASFSGPYWHRPHPGHLYTGGQYGDKTAISWESAGV